MDFQDVAAAVRVGRWLFRHRSFKVIALLPALAPWWKVQWDAAIWPVGIGLILAGGALRLWSISYLGRSARARKDKARRLVTTGPFSLCRNPIYVANMIATSGFITLCEALWYLPMYLGMSFAFYSVVVRYEEYILLHRFPAQFAAYRKRTTRWVPRVFRLRLANRDYGLREVLYRERSFFLAAGAGVSAAWLKNVLSHLIL